MTLHQEQRLESEICRHLAAHGWLYADNDAAHYDRRHALYLPDLLAWIVLDAQLQEAIFDFERTTGVVATITA